MRFLIALAICGIQQPVTVVGEKTATWSYNDPSIWTASYEHCGGLKQSPIDLRDAKVLDAGEIKLDGYNRLLPGEVSNNGHTLKFALGGGSTVQPFISGGRLQEGERFDFVQLHLHWGSSSDKGSEHTVDGRQFPMEIHLVHKNTKYDTLAAALGEQDGLAVLGSFYEVSQEDNPYLENIIDICSNITQAGESMESNITLADFLQADTRDYFYYQGSLTTPPCSEAVLWTNFLMTNTISERQLEKFRSLLDSDGDPIVDNFRPIQPLNSRQLFVTACSGGDSCCSEGSPCGIGEGDCDNDEQCAGDLQCGKDNCNKRSVGFDSTDDCCEADCPRGCPDIWQPVCGSGGNTFANRCELNRVACSSGSPIDILHEGICQEVCPEKEPMIGEPCSLPSDVGPCSYGSECCCGECHPRLKAECIEGRWEGFNTDACMRPQCTCGDPACQQTCLDGEICEATEYSCVQTPCCLAHRCVTECPESCPEYDDPICGSDGKTYSCHCRLRQANCLLGNSTEKITRVHKGPCTEEATSVKRCTGGDSCCAPDDEVCGFGEGDCDKDEDCKEGLICGEDNCNGSGFDSTDDCCVLPIDQGVKPTETAERIIFTLAGKNPLSDFGIWPTQAVQLDNVIYFSAVLGVDHATGLMVEGVRLQARQMFDNLKALLKLMDIDMTRGVKATLYVTNLDYLEVALKVWLEECNWKEYPALTTLQVPGLPHGALMQVDGLAACNNCNTKFYVIGQDSSPSTPDAKRMQQGR